MYPHINIKKLKLKYYRSSLFFRLDITSKNLEQIKDFLNLFIELKLFEDYTYWTSFSTCNTKEFTTVLKSPHINKTAQEQFAYLTFNRTLIVHTFKPAFFLSIIKIIQGSSFPGITLKVTLLLKNHRDIDEYSDLLKIFDPINIEICYISKYDTNNSNRFRNKDNFSLNYVQYLEMFDSYGELFVKKTSYR
jgi:ribosomal protein S10